ncbi:MAG: VWA domain-containing protein [Ignavibacteriales bacterium]|nr:MAG: VWA domain-containing protein [Ignavibacteriaceae bacterium]MBV6446036.1 hypothetical protein [Ignavibacteriaceae bacterium]MBW7872067.1 VWA domain-containing protein [Ignavibacteria bacterium]MCZ2143701.1 VWA domain-containing protein [Ignavibacteriales bacterium]WKZ73660.1 MAG: VWA domain-containing protein [Ignavibacteriaceae bacterium]
MLKFGLEPDYMFLALFILLVPLFAFYYFAKKDVLTRFFKGMDFQKLVYNRSVKKEILRFSLIVSAGLLTLVAMMRPVVGTKVESVKQTGIDVFFLLDASNSMAAEDVKPSRLEKAKFDIELLLKKMAGDRIGMVLFAGESYLQFPLTLDHSIGKMILSSITVNSVPVQGTNIASGVEMAIQGFESSKNKGRAIIIFSDGENHESGAEQAVKKAVADGIRVFTVALGTAKGAEIPVYYGGKTNGVKTDEYGEPVISKANEKMLKSLAVTGGGQFYRSDDNSDYLSNLYDRLNGLEKSEFASFKVVDYDEVFHWFLVPAIILFIASFVINDRKSWVDSQNYSNGDEVVGNNTPVAGSKTEGAGSSAKVAGSKTESSGNSAKVAGSKTESSGNSANGVGSKDEGAGKMKSNINGD